MQEGSSIQQSRQPLVGLYGGTAQSIAVAVGIGVVFFLIAKLGLGLPSPSGFVAVFWPAMGFGVGMLIGLGPSHRWPVLIAITVANFLANFSSGDPPQIALATGLSEAIECSIPAILVHRWFGSEVNLLRRLRYVLGLLAAATIGSAAGAICWIITSRLFYGPTGPIPVTFLHWFMSDMVGFITLGPFVIKLFSLVREPPPRGREIAEGVVALFALALMLAIIIALPLQLWATAIPAAWLFPMVLWLAARCRPFFSAAAAALVSITIVSTTVFGIGHFGDPVSSIDDRILQAQSTILFVALAALVLAALFAERRESEAQIVREQNKLQTTLQQRSAELAHINRYSMAGELTAALAHELNQPLGAIAVNAETAELIVKSAAPDLNEIADILADIRRDDVRAADVINGLRSLLKKRPFEPRHIDLNDVVHETERFLAAIATRREVDLTMQVASSPVPIKGDPILLQQVIMNLVVNAMDAMSAMPIAERKITISTARNGECVDLAVLDAGPGIPSEKLKDIFEPFFTTKPEGMGMGLSIARTIVEAHDGQLSAHNRADRGAAFNISIPVLLASA
jgi:signal transduction histidine kinase